MIIREEKPKERNTVNELIREAFLTAEHAKGNEHELVAALRESDAFIPELSLVAEIDGAIAGHTLFTKGKVGEETVLILYPVSVAFSMKGHGTGGAMILAGQRIARKLGYKYIVVLGSNTYFPRLGYRPASDFGIEPPPGVAPEYYQAIQLDKQAPKLAGPVIYPEPFGI